MTHVPWHPDEATELQELHGIESVELISVGIDIGTTTTQIMLSRMMARRRGDNEYSSEFQITDRETLYKSPIRLTPYESETRIDTEEVGRYLKEWYADAGYSVEDVDTGAVIITGEANKKENADRIIDLFSEQSGRFVCATAGANLETLMAAHGSGAVDFSLDTEQDILHIDIGGGTTKFAHIIDGFVEETAAINVGSRLVVFDDSGEVTRLEDAAQTVASDFGINIELGQPMPDQDKGRLASRFAELVLEIASGDPSPLAEELMVTELPETNLEFDVMTFSGGGAEYVYDRNPGYFNDLGSELGAAIRNEVDRQKIPVAELETGIRATVVGSTQHSVQVSGNTITITDDDLLPLRNVPMVPFVADHNDAPDELTEEILERLDLYDVNDLDGSFAFGFHLHGLPTYDFLRMVVASAVAGWERMAGNHPLILAFDADVAMNAGQIAEKNATCPVIAIDGVELDQFGYIDIGEPLEDTNAVPLTVKSLIFEG